MKKFCCALLLLCAVLWTTVPVRADDELLREQLRLSVITGEDTDIGAYDLTIEEAETLYLQMYYGGQLPWYADGGYSYYYTEETGIVNEFQGGQLDPLRYDRDLYEQKLAELMAESCLAGMTDWQKALSVHEYIALHTAYDDRYQNFEGYDSLVHGSAVCSGYSLLYMDVLNRLGIPCQMIAVPDTGDGEGHGWNLVQLDGQWYHVDVTWDDPSSDIYGRVSHVNFLKTDEEFRVVEEGIEAHDFPWESSVAVAEVSYTQDDFLENVDSAICFVDVDTVVFRIEEDYSNRVVSRNLTTGEETTLYSFDKRGMDLGDGEYFYPTCGLNFWNGRLYFNEEDQVLSMLPDGSDVQTVYSYDVDERYVIGAMADQGVLYLTLSDKDFLVESMEVPLEGVEFHRHSYELLTESATCQRDGFSKMICQCGLSYNETVLEQVEHKMEITKLIEPTSEESGEICHTCSYCGYETREILPPLEISLWERILGRILYSSWLDRLIVVGIAVPLVWILRSLGRAGRRKRSRSR